MVNVKKNLLLNIIYQVLMMLVPFVTAPYVSRVLSIEGMGIYSVTTSIARYFTIFAMLGMVNYGNRKIAQNASSKEELSSTFWSLYFFQFITSILSLIIFLVYCFFSGMDSYGLLVYFQLPYVLSTIFDVSWFFFGTEQFKIMVARNTILKILTTIAVFSFVNNENDIGMYILINALNFLIGQLCLWPYLIKKIYFVKPSWYEVFKHLKPNCILFVSVLAVSIYTLLSKIILEQLSTLVQVGYFENTEKLLTIANAITGAIGTVMLPTVSRLVATDNIELTKEYIGKSMKYIMILAIGISFGISGVSRNFSIVYFGKQYASIDILILAISPAIFLYTWSNIIRTQYILPNNKDSVFVKATIISAIVNVIMNLVLIPNMGALGAVIATVCSQFSESTYQTCNIKRELPIKKYLFELIPFFFIGAFMFSVCKAIEIFFSPSVINLLFQISIGGISYGVISIIYLYIRKDPFVVMIFGKYCAFL